MADAKRGTVVMISTVHWSSTWQRHHHIASGLLKKNYDVIFIEPLPKRWPSFQEWPRLIYRLAGFRQMAGTCPQKEISGIRILSPRLFPDTPKFLSAINRIFFLPSFAQKIKFLIQSQPFILINYLPTPTSLALQEFLRPDLSVYDCACDWAEDPYSKGLERMEEKLLKKADLVFADSSHNFKRLSPRHARVIQLEGGVDFDRFQAAQKPDAKNEKPLCVYYGDIGVNTDLELLAKVSQKYPLRLIGPIRKPLTGFSPATEICGPVSYEEVPKLLKDADIILLAYRRSAHNRNVLPAKTFECLATGKPTVVIGLPDLERYGRLFYLCRDEQEFLRKIAEAPNEDPSLKFERIKFAKENTWEKRIDEMEGFF